MSKKIVKVSVEPKSHNQQVAEENAKRMKGVSDILGGGDDALINSVGEPVTKENMLVLERFVSELDEAFNSNDRELVREKAEQVRNGLLFVGMDSDEVREAMVDRLQDTGIELAPTPEDRMSQARERYNLILSEIEEQRPTY